MKVLFGWRFASDAASSKGLLRLTALDWDVPVTSAPSAGLRGRLRSEHFPYRGAKGPPAPGLSTAQDQVRVKANGNARKHPRPQASRRLVPRVHIGKRTRKRWKSERLRSPAGNNRGCAGVLPYRSTKSRAIRRFGRWTATVHTTTRQCH